MLAWGKRPTVPLGHVLQTDGAVIVSVIVRPPILPVRPHVVAHPLMDGLDAHATELPIIAFSQHVDVPLCIGSTQVSVPALQLSEQPLIGLVPGPWSSSTSISSTSWY